MLSLAPLLARLTGFASGKNDRWIILALLALASAGLWAWGNHQHTKFVTACQIAGSDTSHCLDAIRDLQNFKTGSLAATASALAENQKETVLKTQTDQKAALKNQTGQQQAIEKLDKTNAAIEKDKVGNDWISAFNDVIGLRASSSVTAASSR